jgi:hypothetical protein
MTAQNIIIEGTPQEAPRVTRHVDANRISAKLVFKQFRDVKSAFLSLATNHMTLGIRPAILLSKISLNLKYYLSTNLTRLPPKPVTPRSTCGPHFCRPAGYVYTVSPGFNMSYTNKSNRNRGNNKHQWGHGSSQLRTTRIRCKLTTRSVISTCAVLAIPRTVSTGDRVLPGRYWKKSRARVTPMSRARLCILNCWARPHCRDTQYLQSRTRYMINPPRRSTASSPYPDPDSPSQLIAPSETPRPHAHGSSHPALAPITSPKTPASARTVA